jgi:hypothetical protein
MASSSPEDNGEGASSTNNHSPADGDSDNGSEADELAITDDLDKTLLEDDFMADEHTAPSAPP